MATTSIARARARTGLEIRSLTAAEEAHYAYVAAVNSSTLTDGLALDLGGGSLQVVAVRDREAVSSASWPLGCRARHGGPAARDRPASRKQLKRARAAVRETLAGHIVLTGGGRVVAMGGAVRNLASAAMRTRRGAPASVQGGSLAITEPARFDRRVRTARPRHRALAGIKSARADIILGAAIVLEVVLETIGADALEVPARACGRACSSPIACSPGAQPLIADVRAERGAQPRRAAR